MSRPLVLGHRGDSAHETENTLEAFRAALAAGADGVELDVRLSADRRPIVFHDDDLSRLGGRPEPVERLAAAELLKVALPGGRRIPLFEEVLEELGGVLINAELKSPGAGRAGPLCAAVAGVVKRVRPPRLLFSSFDPLALLGLRLRAAEIPRGLLFHGKLRRPLREAWSAPIVGAAAVHPERHLATEERIARWHRRGFDVNVWTVEDADEIRRLARWGADAIITNDPAAARSALGGQAPASHRRA